MFYLEANCGEYVLALGEGELPLGLAGLLADGGEVGDQVGLVQAYELYCTLAYIPKWSAYYIVPLA